MIARIVSGAQSGVDLAALDAAKELGIETGGWLPRGFLTEDGPRPEYAERYGMLEMPTRDYPSRTRKNVESAHATLIISNVADHSLITGGTRLTWSIASALGERGAGLYLANLNADMVADCREWLAECVANKPDGFVLNCAGPRESKCPGIYAKALAFLLAVLKPEES